MGIEFKHPKFKNHVTVGKQPLLKDEVKAAGLRYLDLQEKEKAETVAMERLRATKRKKYAKRKRINHVIRTFAVSVSATAIILSVAFLVMPSTAKVTYALRQIKSQTVSTAYDNSFEAPEVYMKAENIRRAEELDNVFDLAESKLGCKYVHATAGPDTFDCQGYVHYIFTHCDAKVKCYVPRGGCTNQLNAIKQYQISDDPADAQRGDIVYFYGGGRWKHVGIAMGDGKLIHATTIGPGRACVKITDMPNWYQKYAVVRVLE